METDSLGDSVATHRAGGSAASRQGNRQLGARMRKKGGDKQPQNDREN